MNANRISFVLGNALGALTVGTLFVACGGSDRPTGFGSIPAANVILVNGSQPSAARSGYITVQAHQLPSDVKVLASQVTIANDANRLASADLQTALNAELAVDNAKSIIGSWDILNTTDDPLYSGAAARGRVTFNADGSYVLDSGGLAAAGKTAAGVNTVCTVPTTTGYAMVSNGALYFTANAGGSAFAFIVDSSKDQITMAGQGGCGNVGGMRISTLTRVAAKASASRPEPARL